MTDTWNTQISLIPGIKPNVICEKIERKKTSLNSDNPKDDQVFLYITIQGTMKHPLGTFPLRQLRFNEDIYKLEQEFNDNNIHRAYYALPELLYQGKPKGSESDYNERFFKKYKWTRTGNLSKISKKGHEKSKPAARAVYLGKKYLYCIDKKSRNSLDKSIEVYKVKKYELVKFNIKEEEAKEDNKENIIEINILPEKVLRLKASNHTEYSSWKQGIEDSIKDARLRQGLEEIDNKINEMERGNSKYDEDNVDNFFKGVDKLFKIAESRDMLFEKITTKRPEMGYFCPIYESARKYANLCSLGKSSEALANAKRIYNMVNSFFKNDKNEETQEDSKDNSVNDEVSIVINNLFSKELQIALTELSKKDTIETPDKNLFMKLEAKIVEIINQVYRGADEFNDEEINKLLSIPAMKFMKSVQDPPTSAYIESILKKQQANEIARHKKVVRSMTVINDKKGPLIIDHDTFLDESNHKGAAIN